MPIESSLPIDLNGFQAKALTGILDADHVSLFATLIVGPSCVRALAIQLHSGPFVCLGSGVPFVSLPRRVVALRVNSVCVCVQISQFYIMYSGRPFQWESRSQSAHLIVCNRLFLSITAARPLEGEREQRRRQQPGERRARARRRARVGPRYVIAGLRPLVVCVCVSSRVVCSVSVARAGIPSPFVCSFAFNEIQFHCVQFNSSRGCHVGCVCWGGVVG